MLKALFDSFNEDLKKNVIEQIHNHLFYKASITDADRRVKIIHSRLDGKDYCRVIESGLYADAVGAIGSKSSKILRCYKYFTDRVFKLSEKQNTELFGRLLDRENKYLVLIDLFPHDDEQAIFDTINSAGVRLSGADIVKNALFQRASKVMSEDEVEGLYESCWEGIFAQDEDALAFWDTPKSTGRLMRDNIEILLHSVAVIKGFFDPDVHTLSKLPAVYKTRFDSLDRKELKEFTLEIAEYAKLYRVHILSFDSTSLFSYGDERKRLFHVLDVCEISTFHPYVLALFHKHKSDEASLLAKLHDLERLVIRRLIAKKETKSYNKLCLDFISNNDLARSKLEEVTDQDILTGIEAISNKNAALLLFWIELRRRHVDNKQGVKDLKYNYSLEHVLPQKWEQHWSAIPVKNKEGETLIDQNLAKRERDAALAQIGNMTLLTSSLNSSLKNYSYLIKLKGDGRKKGISSYADLSITKDDIVDAFDGVNKTWDEVAIRARTQALGVECLQVW